MEAPEYNFAGDDDAVEGKSSGAILGALKKAEREFDTWQVNCSTIDAIYSQDGFDNPFGSYNDGFLWSDTRLDLFWASYEVLKPATYARTPVPAVQAKFNDNKPLYNVTGELLERATVQVFSENNINEAMCHTRDDLLFTNRGVLWASLIGRKVCTDHIDRMDFLHEPARYWSEVGWVAKRAWLSHEEAEKRFGENKAEKLSYKVKRDDVTTGQSVIETSTPKAGIWEVWHKADSRVYWVSEGCEIILDDDKPHLDLSGFFPCPRPAYGTLKRRSLVPVPDWNRYAVHFRKISELTGRIYLLLDSVKMKGLIPAGGDVGTAIEQMMADNSDQIVIPVPGAAMMAGGMKDAVMWLPLAEIAAAIQGLIEARNQLIQDFYQLSGISDIMRGATEADETLGAQQLKSHYGSVRVQEKIRELQRIAADMSQIVSEIVAEKFTKQELLDMTGLEIPTKAEVEKQIKELEAAAKAELKQLGDSAQKAAQEVQEQPDPAQAKEAEAAFQKAQQDVIAKYAPKLEALQNTVPVEDVMDLLRDDRARSFAFDIETDSTILTDEMSEKASRNEFMTQFMGASQSLTQLMAMGEQGAALAGAMLKFVVAPYRAGRSLDGAIDNFIEAAPQLAAAAQAQAGGGENADLMEANKMLAEAENKKADAAMASVQARAAQAEADNTRKVSELQLKMQNDAAKAEQENQKLQLQLAQLQDDAGKTAAQVDLLKAQVIKTLTDAGISVKKQNLDEFKSLQDINFRAEDQARQGEQMAVDQEFRARGEDRADMGEQRADRQQQFSETQVQD